MHHVICIMLSRDMSCDLLGSWEEVGVITAFLEVHHDIEEGHRLGASRVQLLKIPCQDPPIVLPGMEWGQDHGYRVS